MEPRYRFLPTLVHGMLDYAAALILAVLPSLTGVSGAAATVCYIGAALAAGYALLTRFELGVYPLLTMPAHLAIDFLFGISFLSAAAYFSGEPTAYRVVTGLLGLTGLSASFLTSKHPTRSGFFAR